MIDGTIRTCVVSSFSTLATMQVDDDGNMVQDVWMRLGYCQQFSGDGVGIVQGVWMWLGYCQQFSGDGVGTRQLFGRGLEHSKQ
jgi:hypothetical protein